MKPNKSFKAVLIVIVIILTVAFYFLFTTRPDVVDEVIDEIGSDVWLNATSSALDYFEYEEAVAGKDKG